MGTVICRLIGVVMLITVFGSGLSCVINLDSCNVGGPGILFLLILGGILFGGG